MARAGKPGGPVQGVMQGLGMELAVGTAPGSLGTVLDGEALAAAEVEGHAAFEIPGSLQGGGSGFFVGAGDKVDVGGEFGILDGFTAGKGGQGGRQEGGGLGVAGGQEGSAASGEKKERDDTRFEVGHHHTRASIPGLTMMHRKPKVS